MCKNRQSQYCYLYCYVFQYRRSGSAAGGLDQVRSRESRSSNVRFYDDMDTEARYHDIHQDIRDLSSSHLRMEDDLDREINRRNRYGGLWVLKSLKCGPEF